MEHQEHNPEYLKSVLELPCPACGNQLAYSAAKQNIVCRHCGFSRTVDQANDMVQERCLREAAQQMKTYTPQTIDKKVVDCSRCGAQLMIEEDQVATRCNFCGSEKVNEKAQEINMIQPQGIIPFKISKRASRDKFKQWIAEGWFTPNKLKRLAQLGDIHGIYVPFWTYDAQTFAKWTGEAGFYYYETEYDTDEEGNTVTREVQKTRWEYRSGSFKHFFDDVLVIASKGVPHALISSLQPFALSEVINYSNELMVGWESEIYSVDVLTGYRQAEQMMDTRLVSMAERKIDGDTHRNIRVDAEKWDQTFKHILLPVWLCTYQYNNKTYQFALNGQTGRIVGSKPSSPYKVAFAIFLVLLVIGGIIFLVTRS